jgi:hypothetical protein
MMSPDEWTLLPGKDKVFFRPGGTPKRDFIKKGGDGYDCMK